MEQSMFVEPARTTEPRVRELGVASSPRIVIVIPAFNEEQRIASVVLTAKKFADLVIVCDDGSRDMTGEIAKTLGAEVIVHGRNLGYGTALASLFTRARELGADIVVTFDGDGQHDAGFVSAVTAPIIDGEADVVIGSRFKSESMNRTPSWRRLGIRMINGVVRGVSGNQYSDTQSGMRAYRAKILKLVYPSETGMGASAEILLRASREGLRVKEVGVPIRYENEKSTQNPILQWLDVVGAALKQASLRHPLKFYGIPGGLFLLVGLIFGAWTLAGYEASGRVTTNVAIVSIGFLIIGSIFSITAIMMYSLVSLIRESRQTQNE
jgi:glycosyltransferase involved in cell wall biosynthesis